MVIPLFKPVLQTVYPLPNPLLRANRLFIENVEKMLLFQISSMKTYFSIGINQVRAAAEITDMESLRDFCERQTEIAQTVQCKLMNDARILSSMVNRFKTEIDNLARTTLEETRAKAA